MDLEVFLIDIFNTSIFFLYIVDKCLCTYYLKYFWNSKIYCISLKFDHLYKEYHAL